MPLVLHEGRFASGKRGPDGGDGFRVKTGVCDQVQDLRQRVRDATIGFDDRRVVGSRLCDRGRHQCITEEPAEFGPEDSVPMRASRRRAAARSPLATAARAWERASSFTIRVREHAP